MVQGTFRPTCHPIVIITILVIGLVLVMPTGNSLAGENKYLSSGPFNIRNQMPLYIFYMAMAPDKAQTLKKGRFSAEVGYHVSNVIIKQHDLWPTASGKQFREDLAYWVIIDTEVSKFYTDIKYGVLDNLEIGVNIPYLDYSEGYLDGFIENFEDNFSFINTPAAREDRTKDVYEYRVDHYGQKIIEDFSKPDGLGEITLQAKYRMIEEQNFIPATVLRMAIKLPTSSDSAELLGSEKVDYGMGILLDKRLSNRLFTCLNFSTIFIEKPDILDKIDVDSYMFSGMFGLEFFMTERTSFLFQTTAHSGVYDKDIPCMRRDGFIFSFGFNHNFSDRVSWQIAVDENGNTVTPDFSVFTSLKIKI